MAGLHTYWKTLPKKSLSIFLLGVFFIFSVVGLASDITGLGNQPTAHLVLNVLISGLFPVLYALIGFALRKQFWKGMIPVFAVHVMFIHELSRWIPIPPPAQQMDPAVMTALQNRLTQDGLAIIVAVAAGYACFLYASITEGRRYFRIHAEVELAAEIHRVLVPVIQRSIGEFEFYGTSAPSGAVGGDLIDVAGGDENWVAYVADVSGHGVAPGVVMGMVKSAARMLLSSGDDASHLMGRLNEVLYPLKKPDMFATFCFVAKTLTGLRVGLAGHPAILRFLPGTNEIEAIEGKNMPLGILPSGEFVSQEVPEETGTLFALYTDGLLEAANQAGEEFGIGRLKEELRQLGGESLEHISRAIQESVARHGAQFDDQSLLLIRRRASPLRA